eukprot:4604518-Pyramimonas_sp.AAC.1
MEWAATRTSPLGQSVELPCGTTTRCTEWGRRMRTPPLGGGAPYGATKRCTGRGRRMRTWPLRPSVELPMVGPS